MKNNYKDPVAVKKDSRAGVGQEKGDEAGERQQCAELYVSGEDLLFQSNPPPSLQCQVAHIFGAGVTWQETSPIASWEKGPFSTHN